MRVSTKGRYGLRALVDLALNSEGEHISLNNIAERQEISVNYLEQVFSVLRKAGIVKSVKGAQGGYILAKTPAELKVGYILRTLEGDLSVAEDISNESTQDISDIQYCIKVFLWDKLDKRINDIVDGITLEDLVNEYRKLTNQSGLMYNI